MAERNILQRKNRVGEKGGITTSKWDFSVPGFVCRSKEIKRYRKYFFIIISNHIRLEMLKISLDLFRDGFIYFHISIPDSAYLQWRQRRHHSYQCFVQELIGKVHYGTEEGGKM